MYGVDRISSLPDDVLYHILSFLPTKYSVRTSVVAKRWRFLFTFVTFLYFDNLSPNTIRTHFNYERVGDPIRFVDFVNRVLMTNTNMTKFRLVCAGISSVVFNSWIEFVIYRNVRELDLSVKIRNFTSLSWMVFSSKMLSVLKVEGLPEMILPSSTFLPCLKELRIASPYVSFSGLKISSIFPNLEDLWFDHCGFEGVLDITHPVLRKLRIVDQHIWIYDPRRYELVLNAPSLVYFEYSSSGRNKISSADEIVFKSLVQARLCRLPNAVLNVDFDAKLVNFVSYARHLFLSVASFRAFQGCSETMPTFHNLIRLEIAPFMKPVLGLLPDLLNRCSLLEVLILDEERYTYGKADMTCYENVPSCVSMHLKEVEFSAIAMEETECKLVEFFLKNGRVLEKMKIQTGLSYKDQLKFCERLFAFRKLSRDCNRSEIRVELFGGPAGRDICLFY